MKKVYNTVIIYRIDERPVQISAGFGEVTMEKRKMIITGACLIIFIILTCVVAGSVGSGTSDTLVFDTVIRDWFYGIRTPWLTEVVKVITFMGNTETIVAICILLLVVPLVIGAVEKITAERRGCSDPGRSCLGLKITKKIGIPVAAVAIAGSAINKIFKHIIMRPRPDVSLHLIEQGGWSFPSGHSISGLLLYGFLAWLIMHYVKGSKFFSSNKEIMEGSSKTDLFANHGQDSDAVFANHDERSDVAFANNSSPRRILFANIGAVLLTLLWIGIGLSRIYLGVHYPTDVLGGWTLGIVIMMIAVTVIDRKK